MKPHKHAEVIHAWADGKTIEYFSTRENQWCYLDDPYFHPYLFPNVKYRIKPAEKVVRWLWAWQDTIGIWSVMHCYMTENEFNIMLPRHSAHKRLEWSREEFDE